MGRSGSRRSWHGPHAIRVLDFPHAAGYLAQAAQASFGPGTAETREWFARQRHALRHGDPGQVLTALPPSAERDTALSYLTARGAMIADAAFDAVGLPIGSGGVERANTLGIEARRTGAGMHWTRDHADAMVARRAMVASGRWATGWPRIVTALQATRRQHTAQRRQQRAIPRCARTVRLPRMGLTETRLLPIRGNRFRRALHAQRPSRLPQCEPHPSESPS
jgi:hypothetical protein